ADWPRGDSGEFPVSRLAVSQTCRYSQTGLSSLHHLLPSEAGRKLRGYLALLAWCARRAGIVTSAASSTNWCRANCSGTNNRNAPADTQGQIIFLQRCGLNEPSPFLKLSRMRWLTAPTGQKKIAQGREERATLGSRPTKIILPLLVAFARGSGRRWPKVG